MLLFLSWATCGIMAAILTDKIRTTLIGNRTTKVKHSQCHKLPSKMLHCFWSPYQTNHLLTKGMSWLFFKNPFFLVQDWSSCCKLLLWARNYKISSLKCYVLLLFVHFKRRNNIKRKMFCVLLFRWDHSNRFSWTYYFTNALLQKTGWWYNGPSSLTLGLSAWFWTS